MIEYDGPSISSSRPTDQGLKQKCQQLEDDLRRSNTDLLQYKDRTQALQKQVNGLKSGMYLPAYLSCTYLLYPNDITCVTR